MACNCSENINNTGLPTSEFIMEVAKKLYFVNLVASDGTRNQIATADDVDAAYFDALINQADGSKRWYPTPLFENVEDVRAENVVETFNSGAAYFVAEGVRTFTGLLPKRSATYLGKLKSIACQRVGFYYVDACGKLGGDMGATGFLRPIPIADGTYSVVNVPATDTTVQKLQMNFQIAQSFRDENLGIIDCSETDADLLSLSGLLDVKATISAPSTTGFVAALKLDYGTFQNKIAVKGWLLADFDLYNETDSAAVTITSVTESPDGTYTFVIPAQTAADVLTLSASKDGFEMADATVTIPA